MIIIELVVLGTLFIDIILGVVVYSTNSRRVVNQHYLLFAISIALWQLAGWKALNATSNGEAIFAIRMASVFAALIPTSCHLLRISIKHPDSSFFNAIYRAKYFILVNVLTTYLCFTRFFLKSVVLPRDSLTGALVVEPRYGGGLLLYALYFLGSGIGLVLLFKRDMRALRGGQRSELAFVVFGATVALLLGAILSLSIPLFFKTSQYVPFANAISIIALVGTVGYGIATHRILGIVTIIQKIVAHTMLAIYLIVLYLCVWWIVTFVLRGLSISSSLIASLVSALSVAFSMAPVHGRLQKVATKLIAAKTMDVATTMKKASNIFQTVSTINALHDHFSKLLTTSLSAEHVMLLAEEGNEFRQNYPSSETAVPVVISQSDATTDLIRKTREPLCRDTLVRMRETPASKAAEQQLKEANASVAIGIFSKNELRGFVLLGPRLDGRIYDKTEQDALQILCNQFAVALENAQMYTEMQDSKIRNEIMLDQMVSGVIVANPERKITLLNHEARRITGIKESSAMGKDINILPKPIRQIMETTLAEKTGTRNVDAMLFNHNEDEESISIRMGSAYLFGQDEKTMGALLVFTDITELKSLEEQVRRSDQLSSVGTLAAGMAHEIKNPLVTIKTFTQLLPKRYAEEDFRKNFSTLVAQEVGRIDGIVNELLSFSKLTKPHLSPMDLQQTIDQTLKLTREQMTQKNIGLRTFFHADTSSILGDGKLLSQALVNLCLNAIEAIGTDGTITVGTVNCKHRFAEGESAEKAITKESIRLQISDTGEGIAQENLQKIFDPFYTSKSEGTGMGLAVAHGIIREHDGVLEVESELGKGATFFAYIPVCDQEAEE